jgi:hypothetical protein
LPAQAAASPARTGLEGVSPDYRIRFSRWIAAARPHYGVLLLPFVGYFLIFTLVLAVSALVGLLPIALLAAEELGWFRLLGLAVLPVALLTWFVLVPGMAAGFHVVCQAQLKGHPWSFGTFFTGFRWSGTMSARMLLLLVLSTAIELPALAIVIVPQTIWREPPIVVVGTTSALMLAVLLTEGYLLVRLVFFSHLIIIDRGCGLIDALRGSWLLSRGHFWGLLGVLIPLLVVPVSAPILLAVLPSFVDLPSTFMIVVGVMTIVSMVCFLPAIVLVLNAGYLLITGAIALPGCETGAERWSMSPSKWRWLQIGLTGAAVVLYGVGNAWSTSAERSRIAGLLRQRQEEAARHAEEYRLAEMRAEAESESQARELVQFFRAGGIWSLEVYPWEEGYDEAMAGAAPIEGGMGNGDPGADIPGLGAQYGGAEGASWGTERGPLGGSSSPRRTVLVMGPRGLAMSRRETRLGERIPPDPSWNRVLTHFDELESHGFGRLNEVFFPLFAEALASGEVEASLVVMTPKKPMLEEGGAVAAPDASVLPDSFVDGPASGGAASSTPDNVGGQGFSMSGMGYSASATEYHPSVSLETAEPVARERFLQLTVTAP